MILDYFGSNVPIHKLYENKSIPADGLSASYLEKLNDKYKLCMKAYKVSKKELGKHIGNLVCPFVIYWNKSHFIVVEKIKNNKWSVIDPAFGRIKYTYEEVLDKFSEYIFVFNTKNDYKKVKEINPFITLFKSTLKSKQTAMFILSMIIGQFCVMAFAASIKNIISQKYNWIISLVVLMSIILIELISTLTKINSLKKYNIKFEEIITHEIFKGIFNQNIDFFKNHTPGSLFEKINLKSSIRDSVVIKIVPAIINLMSIVVVLGYLFTISVALTSFLLVLTVIYLIITTVYYNKQLELSSIYIQCNIDLASLIQSTLENIEWIKALRKEDTNKRKWICESRRNLEEYNKIVKIEGITRFLGIIFNFITLSVILLVAIYFKGILSINFADIILFQTVITIFISSMESIKYAGFEISKLRITIEKQLDLIKKNDEKKLFM